MSGTRARRVVVTGVGAVSPLGHTLEASWKALLEQKSGATSLKQALEWQGLPKELLEQELELIQSLPCQVAAAVPLWNGKQVQPDNTNYRTSRNVQFALEAGRQAVEQSKLLDYLKSSEDANDKESHYKLRQRMGVSMGCGMPSFRDITSAYQTMTTAPGGYRKISPHFVPKSLTNAASGRLSIEFGLFGPNCTTSGACAAASHAIGDAYRMIQLGQADVMLAGGSEASIEPVGIAGFCRLRALSTAFTADNLPPSKASRPFDARRDGFVMGEGAAVLVLEELDHAKARGAPVLLAEVIGYGLAGDGHHITAPDPQGRGAEHAMRMALNFDRDLAAQVDYVNAHATSTPVGDDIEARVIDRVLCGPSDSRNSRDGNQHKLYVSSTKGATGHLLGAAGAIEAAFTVQTLFDQIIPVTLNLETVDDKEKVSFEHVVAATSHHHQGPHVINVAMSNSFGFGGTNASLVFARIDNE